MSPRVGDLYSLSPHPEIICRIICVRDGSEEMCEFCQMVGLARLQAPKITFHDDSFVDFAKSYHVEIVWSPEDPGLVCEFVLDFELCPVPEMLELVIRSEIEP